LSSVSKSKRKIQNSSSESNPKKVKKVKPNVSKNERVSENVPVCLEANEAERKKGKRKKGEEKRKKAPKKRTDGIGK